MDYWFKQVSKARQSGCLLDVQQQSGRLLSWTYWGNTDLVPALLASSLRSSLHTCAMVCRSEHLNSKVGGGHECAGIHSVTETYLAIIPPFLQCQATAQ